MTEVKTLTEQLTVSGQISAADVEALKAAGVRSIVCNRPDNEEANQVAHTTIADAAKDKGIEFVFMPVISGQMTQDNVDDFAKALKSLPEPIHAYCRSGMRCTSLWGLSQKQAGVDARSIAEKASTAGYDISKLL